MANNTPGDPGIAQPYPQLTMMPTRISLERSFPEIIIGPSDHLQLCFPLKSNFLQQVLQEHQFHPFGYADDQCIIDSRNYNHTECAIIIFLLISWSFFLAAAIATHTPKHDKDNIPPLKSRIQQNSLSIVVSFFGKIEI